MRRNAACRQAIGLLLLGALSGCGGTSSSADDGTSSSADGGASKPDAAPDASPEPEPLGTPLAASPCIKIERTSLPGVRIQFTTQKCSYTVEEAKGGITLEYAVIVEGDLPTVYFPAGSGRAPITQHEQLNEKVGGAGGYVTFDLPTRPSGNVAMVKRGIYRTSVRWDGMTFAVKGSTGTPRISSYELDVGAFFYANQAKSMEERPLHEVKGILQFSITNAP